MILLEKYLSQTPMSVINPGLESVEKLAEICSHPEKDLKFIHVAGTNGKGSCCAMLERTLREVGFKTGFYSSPHLVKINERFRINGTEVDDNILDEETEKLIQLTAGKKYSYFEFTTILALNIFKRQKVDICIWETGMGGRWDATNIVNPIATAITNIALDHQEYLGDCIEKIAAEKAGIIKKNIPVFIGDMPTKAREVILSKAKELECETFTFLNEDAELQGFSKNKQKISYKGLNLELSLLGEMQRKNFKLVFSILEYLSKEYSFDLKVALNALSKVTWEARCQVLNDKIILDGGHNVDGLTALVKSLNEFKNNQKFIVVFGAYADKEIGESLRILSTVANKFIFTPLPDGVRKSYTGNMLCERVKRFTDIPCESVDNIETAFKKVYNSNCDALICGSLYLSGEILKLWGER